MTSTCISACVNDIRDPRIPVRATYVNLYKWPESDAEFLRAISASGSKRPQMYGLPRVVDSLSCRQMYLRSYKFTRSESVPEKTQKCFGGVKGKVKQSQGKKTKTHVEKKRVLWRKAKGSSCSLLLRIFQRLLFCTASVDVVDQS